ncbi:Na+/H+ antiporter NhaC family protein [Caldalkalibacillus salinus]|uniref:Na+/H+ antiporter NhaC family protein n=1 Tax=Caldalkalibacillus salinus TaxID=2803787 RepID=UPI0019246A07|nr:Na+/H+ antiporter NhaC family protein [Caldalkalibacillus salinus]
MEGTIYSLIPPLLALLMVVITRRVLISLGLGIVVGTLMINGTEGDLASFGGLYDWIVNSVVYVFDIVRGIFVVFEEDTWQLNSWEFYIILFLLLLGMMAALIALSGGSRAFGEWAQSKVKTKKGAQLSSAILGVIIFIDDYFNSLLVGNVSRPLTDRHRVSRAKLAYLVDSTAAPMCVIAPVSSWGAYIITIIAGILTHHGITQYEALQAFMYMIPMNLYALSALVLVFAVIMYRLDVGPMKEHEERAEASGEVLDTSKGAVPGHQDDEALKQGHHGKTRDLIMPIITLVVATVFFMITTGIQGTEGNVTLLSIFVNTDVAAALVYGGLIGLGVAVLLTSIRLYGVHHFSVAAFKDLIAGLWAGIKSMLPAIYILVFAWTIIEIIGALKTGAYLASIIDGNIPVMLLPALVFLISGIMAFSTGTSWGTFGMLLPIAGEMAVVVDVQLLLPMLAAVLAGAIFGDHCSPISDTTILSSTGAGSHHIDHVMTQLPYALMAAATTFIGYLALGFTGSALAGIVATLLSMAVVVYILKAKLKATAA